MALIANEADRLTRHLDSRKGMVMNDKDWALVKELRAIARMPKGHGFKRRHGDSHRKVWGFPTICAKTRRKRGRG